jgi:hypothetical protein
MQFRSGDKDAAANSFAAALKIAPDLEFPAKYGAPDVRALWDRAKAAAAAAAPAGKAPPPPEQPTGDFTHAPADEQKTRTPLPVYVEYGGSPPPARVVVKYKSARMSEWGHVDLKATDDGWEGLIPCTDVTAGTMRYWIQGVDKGGDPVASSGDPKHPFTVPVRADISGDAPHLPGKAPPKRCAAGGDGDDQGGDQEGGDGESGHKTSARHGRHGDYSRIWVGASFGIDLISMPAGNDVCLLSSNKGEPLNPSELYCTNPNGTDFPSRANPVQNATLVPGQAGAIGGGLQAGDVRLMLSGDYALNPNILVGGRLGYVANAYTGSAASKDGRAAGFDVHIEARATYLFGEDALARTGFLPMVFAGFGLAEFDGHTSSLVTVTSMMAQQPVTVWRTDGPFFLMLGGGARYQYTPQIAFTGALRLDLAIGNGALLTYGPEIGAQYGF